MYEAIDSNATVYAANKRTLVVADSGRSRSRVDQPPRDSMQFPATNDLTARNRVAANWLIF
jgi:hypothetical protein